MLHAGTAARTCLDCQFLCRIEELLLRSSIQVLEVLWGRWGLEIYFIFPDVSIALCIFLLLVELVYSGSPIVMVGVAIRLDTVMMVDTMAIDILVSLPLMKVEVMGCVIKVIAHGFLRV